jgi:BTB/POZ domain/Kelch motif/Galactose oxidase, central domain
MPTSPAKTRRQSSEGHRPKMCKATGQKPACLVNASVTYCGNNQIYAFGGFDQFTDEVYNHVLKLDLYTLNWALVDNYGDIPGVRMGHSASLHQGHKLLVYGGENEHREYLSDVVILDLKTMHWTQPDVQGPQPRGRARHASVVYEDKLFIIGGLTGETNYILDDICYLDLKTWTWSRTWSFVGRFDHSAWIWGGRLWVFGGLGPEMERSTEIWWLDLKGSPSLGIPSMEGFSDSSGLGRCTSGSVPSYGTTSNLNPVTNAYAANSGSVHVRSSRKDRPNAPGAISSLKFLSGPHVPPQSSGTHFHVYSSGTLLDFVTPAATIRSTECNLSSLELDSLRWQKLVEGSELFQPGYRWHYCTVNEDGTKAWLLGSQIDTNSNGGQDAQLSEVLAVDLRKYGLLGNDLVYQSNSEQRRILASERETSLSQGLGTELASMFDTHPESGSMTDFTITANADESDLLSSSNDDSPIISNDEQPSTRFSIGSTASAPLYLSTNTPTSPPIHVHKMILQARWPHFKRLYSAKMAEFHNQKMHVPEPYSVVRAFLYYLYTDSIAPHNTYCQDLTDVAGMLVMANLYDMPKLRLLCVHRLSREMDVEHAAIVWERAGRTNEEWLRQRAARFCLGNWGRVVRTEGFKGLSRGSLMELCEVVDMEGRVVNGEELEAVGGSMGWCVDGGRSGSRGGDGAGGRLRARGARRSSDVDDADAEDEDGMEIS